MRILDFIVKGQSLTKNPDCDFGNIVAGTRGYLSARFQFYGNEWNTCKKAASFYLEDREFAVLLDENNSCLIPNEVLVSDRFEVSLTGLKNEMLIKTTKVKVKQEVV